MPNKFNLGQIFYQKIQVILINTVLSACLAHDRLFLTSFLSIIKHSIGFIQTVCISNIYLHTTTKNIDKDLYVVYDCFNKGSISCSSREEWLKEFCFFFEKLSPTSKKIVFFTVQIDFPVDADPGLLALAYAVSIAEERHPAANESKNKRNWLIIIMFVLRLESVF